MIRRQQRQRLEEEEVVPLRKAMQRENTIELIAMTHDEPTIQSDVILGNASNDKISTTDNEDEASESMESLSTVEDLLEDDPLIMAVEDATAAVQEPIVIWLNDSSCTPNPDPHKKEIDVAKYMASREMTPLQERVNAITMIPNPLYCLYFICSGCWISESLVQEYRDADVLDFDSSSCNLSPSSWLPTAMPPAAILAVLYGITIHAPFSFLYHWRYAHAIPAGLERTGHWSRRMDHSMIHVASMFLSYAACNGNWDYTLVNILFNADCIYRQFKTKVRPRRNQIRVGMSILAYTIPILSHGDVLLFSRLWFIMLLAGWFFVRYPVGGWSHALFHLLMCGLPYFMMKVATDVSEESPAMHLAAQCAVLAERGV